MALAENKSYFAVNRLSPIAEKAGFCSVNEMISQLVGLEVTRPAIVQEILESLLVRETLFFRDGFPFQSLADEIFPKLMDNTPEGGTVTVWCGACSTGQEPWSIAMVWRERFGPTPPARLQIIGTDLSPWAVEKAREGKFSWDEAKRGLSPVQMKKFFRETPIGVEIIPELRPLVSFRTLDLRSDFPGLLPRADVIFLRNVLIYFSQEEKTSILAKAARVLKPQGALFLGASESMIGLPEPWGQKSMTPGGFYLGQ